MCDNQIDCFPDGWEIKSLKDISTQIAEKVGEQDLETLSISAGIGFVNQAEKFGRELSGEQYEKYTVLRYGDFSYNKGNSKTYPQGCIYRLEERRVAAVPNVFNSFSMSDNICDSDYYAHLFTSGYLNRQLFRLINTGVRNNGLLNIYDVDFYSCKLPVPPLAEQQKIAEILTQCDKVIELKQQLIEEERKRKKWLMKNLLDPDSGVRLRGFEGSEWHNSCIGEIMKITSCKRVHESDWTECGVPFYRAREIVALHEKLCISPLHISHELYEAFSALCGKVQVGDLLVTGVGTIGVPYLVSKNEALYFKDGNIIWFKNRGAIDNLYFYYAFDGEYVQKQIRDMAGIGTVGTYTIEGAKKTKIYLPSYDEQKSIAAILCMADQKIELICNELAQWQQKKKALMQLLLTGLVRVTT